MNNYIGVMGAAIAILILQDEESRSVRADNIYEISQPPEMPEVNLKRFSRRIEQPHQTHPTSPKKSYRGRHSR